MAQLLDRQGGVMLHLIPEQQQAAHAQPRLQGLAGEVGDLLLRHPARQGLRGHGEHIVASLGVALRLDFVVRGGRLGQRDALNLLVAALHEDLRLAAVAMAHNNAARHPAVIEVQLLHDAQLLGPGGGPDHITQDRPAARTDHRDLDLVPDERAVPQRRDGMAAGEGMPSLGWHPALNSAPVRRRRFLAVGQVEAGLGEKPGGLDRNDAAEVHAVLRDGPRLVEHHGGDLPGDRDAAWLQATDLMLRLQALGRHGLPHDHAHRKHRAQAHRHRVEQQQVGGDPRVQLDQRRQVDHHEEDHVDANEPVYLRQLVVVPESHARGEQDHPHELAPRGEGPDGLRDHHGLALVRPRGLQASRAGVGDVLLCDAGVARVLHGHLLDGHRLACEHGLVHD
mmetsp:Transcript_106070/g.306808  ORF Transcript_106070/g.306808 Transcript_106070/m.306808 type:complete len:394 (-) Transcript_106070:1256-2437(-)